MGLHLLIQRGQRKARKLILAAPPPRARAEEAALLAPSESPIQLGCSVATSECGDPHREARRFRPRPLSPGGPFENAP